MPTRNVNLTERQDQFVGEVLAAGRYQNASEVVRDGLRLLERREREDAAKLARLQVAVEEAESALARGEYEDVADDQLAEWLSSLGASGRGPSQP
jgi:antitoxin ParD1/3/4